MKGLPGFSCSEEEGGKNEASKPKWFVFFFSYNSWFGSVFRKRDFFFFFFLFFLLHASFCCLNSGSICLLQLLEVQQYSSTVVRDGSSSCSSRYSLQLASFGEPTFKTAPYRSNSNQQPTMLLLLLLLLPISILGTRRYIHTCGCCCMVGRFMRIGPYVCMKSYSWLRSGSTSSHDFISLQL